MAGNRKLPFGYRMELGKIVIHPEEASTVHYIFQQYTLGASYNDLVENLRKQNVPYDQGKLWNKNMVARILENRKYTGQPGWPSIINIEVFERANEKRTNKVSPPKQTDAQKVLRRLSGEYDAESEQAVLHLLNQLIAEPQKIITPQPIPSDINRVSELQSALDHELEGRFNTLLEQAAEQMDSQEYITEFQAITNEIAGLKEQRTWLEAQRRNSAAAAKRMDTAVSLLTEAAPELTEWNESTIRQLVDTVRVISVDEIVVYLQGGMEITQEITG